MPHTYDHHLKCVTSLCRICANRNLTKKQKLKNIKPVCCLSQKNDLLLICEINVHKDKPTQHPNTICKRCYRRFGDIKRSHNEKLVAECKEEVDINKNIWVDFDANCDEQNCKVCFQYSVTCLEVAQNISTSSCNVISDSSTPSQPVCEDIIVQAEVDEASVFVSNAMSTQIKPYIHLTSATTSPVLKYDCTVQEIMDKPITYPLTQMEKSLLTHLISRRLNMTGSNIIKCITRGQPIVLRRIIQYNTYSSVNDSESDSSEQIDEDNNNTSVVGSDCLSSLDKMNTKDKTIAAELKRISLSQNGMFMADFHPEKSRRKLRKKNRKTYNKELQTAQLYDEKGVLLETSLDLCDCLNITCPGCHFPCPFCTSHKCGIDCRCNRKYTIDSIEVEGTDHVYTFPT